MKDKEAPGAKDGEKKPARKRSVHEGHRKRVRETIRKTNAEGMADHQVLEVLLFYSIPNGDTNELAHRLIKRFGTLKDVIDADFDDLLEVEGVGESTADLIRFTKIIAGRYIRSAEYKAKAPAFYNTDQLRMYYEGVFIGKTEEEIHIMALDDDLRIKREKILAAGAAGEVTTGVQELAGFALRSGCSRIVVAHNHPRGSCMPSRSDVEHTSLAKGMLAMLGVELVDHVIVGLTGSTSLRASDHGKRLWPEDHIHDKEDDTKDKENADNVNISFIEQKDTGGVSLKAN